jgi:glutathione S-transferase
MVWDVYVQRIVVPGSGGQADEALIASALPALKTVLQEIDDWRGDSEFLVGDAITLADLYAYPMLRCFHWDSDSEDGF